MISPRLPAQTEDSVQFDGFEAVVGGEQRGPDSMKEVASWPWGTHGTQPGDFRTV